MIPLLIQFTSAPLSMSATVLVEKSSTAKITIENHFWNVTLDMVCRNFLVGIFDSCIPVISTGIVFGISVFGVWDWIMASLASTVKSVVLRLRTSVLRYLILVFNWLISC